MTNLTIGAVLSDINIVSTGSKPLTLADYRGKNVLLYFYPKDNTPTCTQQAQYFRDNYAQFNALNCVILGVSRDSVRSHDTFKSKHALPFDLIADTDEQLCQLFDVLKMKNLYGKQVRGIERSTFLINAAGVFTHEWRKVKVKDHCAAVLSVLSKLNAAQTSNDN